MTKFARIEDGQVREVVEIDGKPEDFFHPSLKFVPAPVGCTEGWVVDGEMLRAPAPDLYGLRATKKRAIEIASAEREAAGFTFDGKVFQIDERSRQDITGVALRAGLVVLELPGITWREGFEWIAKDNTRVKMSAIEFLGFAQGVADRVSAIAMHRRDLKDALVAAETAEQIDAVNPKAGWPVDQAE